MQSSAVKKQQKKKPCRSVFSEPLGVRFFSNHADGGATAVAEKCKCVAEGAQQLSKLAPNLWLPEQMEEKKEEEEAWSQSQAVRGGLRGLNTLWSQPGVNQPLRTLTNHSFGTTPLE